MNVPKDIELWLRTSYIDGYYDGQAANESKDYKKKIELCEIKIEQSNLKNLFTLKHQLESLKQQQKVYERGYNDGQTKRQKLKGGI